MAEGGRFYRVHFKSLLRDVLLDTSLVFVTKSSLLFKLALDILSHLFCTLISENQGLEKLRSILNLRKISGPAELNFFSVHLNFFQFVT